MPLRQQPKLRCTLQSKPAGPAELLSRASGALYALLMNVFGLLFEPLQRLIGARRMPYVFLLPNLLIFSVFILFPMLLNFYYAFTGGTNLFPADRPFVGTENFERLFDCSNFLYPDTSSEDRFWRAMRNTGVFVLGQVGVFVLIALVSALVATRPSHDMCLV